MNVYAGCQECGAGLSESELLRDCDICDKCDSEFYGDDDDE